VTNPTPQARALSGALERLVRIEHGEWPRFWLAFAYFFFLLGGYFMLRPIRGTVASNNADILHWLYTATFGCMLLIVPVFGFLVARFRRGVFIPASYLFFIVQLGLFAWGFADNRPGVWVQRVFYVWLSVFNLFVVSVFWSFMADIFQPGQAKRLFGSIMAGGSLGAIAGPLVTAGMVGGSGATGVMAMSMACLLIATASVDNRDRVPRQMPAESLRCVRVSRIGLGAGSAIDARGSNLHSAPFCSRRSPISVRVEQEYPESHVTCPMRR